MHKLIAVFAALSLSTSAIKLGLVLLSYSITEIKTNYSAVWHCETVFIFKKNIFIMSFQNLVALTGDICSKTLVIAQLTNWNLIGRAIYQFRLAAHDILSEYSSTIGKIRLVSKRSQNLKRNASLKNFTGLASKVSITQVKALCLGY